MTHNWEDLELAFNAARKPIPMQPFKHWMRFNKFKDYKKYVMSKAKCLYCGSLIYDSNANYQKIHDPETCPMNPTKPLLPSAGGVKEALERISKYEVDDGKLSRDMLYEVIDIATKALSEGQPAQGKV